MGWKKLTVIVVAAAALVGGALSLSMYLTRQQELEMEVADQKPQPATGRGYHNIGGYGKYANLLR